MGTEGSNQKPVYFTDACNNGAVNFVILEVDVVTKDVDLKFWKYDQLIDLYSP